jgi:hypothetical protein
MYRIFYFVKIYIYVLLIRFPYPTLFLRMIQSSEYYYGCSDFCCSAHYHSTSRHLSLEQSCISQRFDLVWDAMGGDWIDNPLSPRRTYFGSDKYTREISGGEGEWEVTNKK